MLLINISYIYILFLYLFCFLSNNYWCGKYLRLGCMRVSLSIPPVSHCYRRCFWLLLFSVVDCNLSLFVCSSNDVPFFHRHRSNLKWWQAASEALPTPNPVGWTCFNQSGGRLEIRPERASSKHLATFDYCSIPAHVTDVGWYDNVNVSAGFSLQMREPVRHRCGTGALALASFLVHFPPGGIADQGIHGSEPPIYDKSDL